MSTPRVQYGYADGSANTVRPASMTYPDGRVLSYGYGSANGIDDAASRVQALIDDDLGLRTWRTTHTWASRRSPSPTTPSRT